MSERILLRGGQVITMDEGLGELGGGDVLIEGAKIADVAPRIDVEDAEILDVSGHVVMPGFIDTHRHTWQTPFRGVCADWTLEDYFRGIRMSISPNCSAEDIYAGNYVGALEALEAGVTTILDFSHCNNTPEHADGALQGLRDSGYGRCSPTATTPHRRPSRYSPSTDSGWPMQGVFVSRSSRATTP